MVDFKPEDIICKFTDELFQKGDVDIEEYCKEYPSLKDVLLKRYHAIKFIEEGLKEEDWAGKKIGEYIIIEEIGRGGMGVVFLAIQPSLNRYVALKILPYGLTFDSSAVKRFQNEAKILAKFHHPNIAPVFSNGEEQGIYYIAMAFICGLSLNKIINGMKHLSKSEIKASTIRDIILEHPDFIRFNFDLRKSGIQDSIMLKRGPEFWQKSYPEFIATIYCEVIDALSYAHNNKVYHGDLKPSNIILTPEGIPMVVDFGLAKDIKAITTMQSKEFAGTIAYASPEQVRNNIINEKTDIWSLGVSLYESVALIHPFYGETVSETLNKIMNSEPPFLKKFNRKLSKDLEAIIFKCLEKSPNKRYSNISALEDDLKNFLESKPIKAKPIGIVGRLYKWIMRNPFISTLISLAIILGFVSSFLLFNKKINDFINNGDIFYSQGNYNNALYAYNKALSFLKLLPFSKQRRKVVFSSIGDVWLGNGAYEKAISYYQKAIEIDFKYCSALGGLGDANFEKGSYDEAIKFYNSVIKSCPNDRYNYYMRGRAFTKKGLLDDAIENYLIAIGLAPNDLDTLGEIVSILNRKGLNKDDKITQYLKDKNFNNEQIKSVLKIIRETGR